MAGELCLTCGLCCNGGLFADVKLQPGDNPAQLRALGLPLTPLRKSASGAAAPEAGHRLRFAQPCAALDGCRCRLYPDRPHYCREFECLLLQSVQTGRTEKAAALRIIRTAVQRADRVRFLLRELGDDEEQLRLAARFRRMARRVEREGLDEPRADLYGQLTLAVHDLNLLLSEAFYPGAAHNKGFAPQTDRA
jgi:hypothetical protein